MITHLCFTNAYYYRNICPILCLQPRECGGAEMLSMPRHWNALNEKYHEQEAETKIFQPFWEGIARGT